MIGRVLKTWHNLSFFVPIAISICCMCRFTHMRRFLPCGSGKRDNFIQFVEIPLKIHFFEHRNWFFSTNEFVWFYPASSLCYEETLSTWTGGRLSTWTGGRLSAQGCASSSCPASLKSVASPPNFAAKCIPIGSRSRLSYKGTVMAGCPITFHTIVKGENAILWYANLRVTKMYHPCLESPLRWPWMPGRGIERYRAVQKTAQCSVRSDWIPS